MEKLQKRFGVQKESFDFGRDPEAEGFSAPGGVAAITTEDSHGANGFVLEMLFVVATQVAVTVHRPDVLAVGTGRAFEQSQLCITLLLGLEDPLQSPVPRPENQETRF